MQSNSNQNTSQFAPEYVPGVETAAIVDTMGTGNILVPSTPSAGPSGSNDNNIPAASSTPRGVNASIHALTTPVGREPQTDPMGADMMDHDGEVSDQADDNKDEDGDISISTEKDHGIVENDDTGLVQFRWKRTNDPTDVLSAAAKGLQRFAKFLTSTPHRQYLDKMTEDGDNDPVYYAEQLEAALALVNERWCAYNIKGLPDNSGWLPLHAGLAATQLRVVKDKLNSANAEIKLLKEKLREASGRIDWHEEQRVYYQTLVQEWIISHQPNAPEPAKAKVDRKGKGKARAVTSDSEFLSDEALDELGQGLAEFLEDGQFRCERVCGGIVLSTRGV